MGEINESAGQPNIYMSFMPKEIQEWAGNEWSCTIFITSSLQNGEA